MREQADTEDGGLAGFGRTNECCATLISCRVPWLCFKDKRLEAQDYEVLSIQVCNTVSVYSIANQVLFFLMINGTLSS